MTDGNGIPSATHGIVDKLSPSEIVFVLSRYTIGFTIMEGSVKIRKKNQNAKK